MTYILSELSSSNENAAYENDINSCEIDFENIVEKEEKNTSWLLDLVIRILTSNFLKQVRDHVNEVYVDMFMPFNG